jgi:hypothetical protein
MVTLLGEIDHELAIVEDLAIGADPDGPILVGHRLCTCGEVDDGESPMTEDDILIPMDTLTIRPAVPKQRHASEVCGWDGFRTGPWCRNYPSL